MFYIASERSLLIDGVADDTLEAKVRQRWAVIGLNVAAIVVALVVAAGRGRSLPGHDAAGTRAPADPSSPARAVGRRENASADVILDLRDETT